MGIVWAARPSTAVGGQREHRASGQAFREVACAEAAFMQKAPAMLCQVCPLPQGGSGGGPVVFTTGGALDRVDTHSMRTQMAAVKPAGKPGLEEDAAPIHRIRITLTSRNTAALEKGAPPPRLVGTDA